MHPTAIIRSQFCFSLSLVFQLPRTTLPLRAPCVVRSVCADGSVFLIPYFYGASSYVCCIHPLTAKTAIVRLVGLVPGSLSFSFPSFTANFLCISLLRLLAARMEFLPGKLQIFVHHLLSSIPNLLSCHTDHQLHIL